MKSSQFNSQQFVELGQTKKFLNSKCFKLALFMDSVALFMDCKRAPCCRCYTVKTGTPTFQIDVLQIYFNTVEGLPHDVWGIIVLDLGASSITCQQIISGSSHGLIFRAIRHVDHSRHRIPARDVMTPPWRKARAIGEG